MLQNFRSLLIDSFQVNEAECVCLEGLVEYDKRQFVAAVLELVHQPLFKLEFCSSGLKISLR